MSARCALAALALLLAACPGRPDRDAGDAHSDAAARDDGVVTDADVPTRIGDPCTGAPAGRPAERGSCAAGQLCETEDNGFPGGYCVARCAGAAACPPEAACVALGAARTCLRACRTHGDCRFAERYRCTPVDGGAASVCLPVDAPTGLRDGSACYTVSPGPHQLAPLARRTFATANLAASAGHADTALAAEGNVAVAPAPPAAVVAPYIAVSAAGAAFIGVTTARGATLERAGTLRDPLNTDASDPVVAFTRDGALHAVLLGVSFDALGRPRGARVRVAESADQGQSFGAPREVSPEATCATASCDKPWLAAGPAPGAPPRDALYVGYAVEAREVATLVVQRSDDGGSAWSAPVAIAASAPQDAGTTEGAPNLVTLAVGDDGALHAAWVEVRGSRYVFGDAGNRVMYRRSLDGARTWEPARLVSEPGQSVVYQPPAIAVTAAGAHVAYVAGAPSGAWDVVLASSADGGARFAHRRVNDEPDTCATHQLPALAADATRGLVHVTWLENRFGEGAAAYTACPVDASRACARNEQVSDAAFTLTTSRDPRRWHGDYGGLAVAPDGALWAAWSDTRTGSPAVYLARGAVP